MKRDGKKKKGEAKYHQVSEAENGRQRCGFGMREEEHVPLEIPQEACWLIISQDKRTSMKICDPLINGTELSDHEAFIE